MVQTMELLAPAGSLQAFAAAMEAGADAVYIGAPELNARNLAKHFSLAEIAAMVDHAHRLGKKLYVAMNSLAKEKELARVLSLLSFFSAIGVDALIVQDIGIAVLARRYFPELPLHASTLMTAHNSLSVATLFAKGFKRVVLARELTLEEIGAIHRSCPGELEVFVHGAMCFSYSGLCLFSSYQGGKSSLRGRCVQPCRRRYGLEGGESKKDSGYLFSMHDMQAIDLLPRLAQTGVTSLKIEGRMRPASYVEKVVRAYRMVLDRPNEPAVVEAARSLLQSALGRKSSSGFFLKKQPVSLLSPEHSGNTGVFIGRIEAVEGKRVRCSLRHPLAQGDRLRLHQEKSGERVAFTLQAIFSRKTKRPSAEVGDRVMLEMPVKAAKGDSLFLVDSSANRKKEGLRSTTLPALKKIPASRLPTEEGVLRLLSDFYKTQRKGSVAATARPGRSRTDSGANRGGKGGRDAALPYFLRLDDLAHLRQRLERNPLGYIVVLNPETLAQFDRSRLPAPVRQQLIWGLPPIIDEETLPFYRREIGNLISKGFTAWQIAHLSHLSLFSDPEVTGRRRRRQSLTLHGHYTLNVLNSAALFFYQAAGLERVQLAIEIDRDNLIGLAAKNTRALLGMTVYGFPPLFTARLQHPAFPYGKTILSPKKEKFRVLKQSGQTVVISGQPFCLLDRQEDLARAGIGFVVVDLAGARLSKKDWQELNRMLKRGWCGSRPTGKFNFAGTLQ